VANTSWTVPHALQAEQPSRMMLVMLK